MAAMLLGVQESKEKEGSEEHIRDLSYVSSRIKCRPTGICAITSSKVLVLSPVHR